MSVVLPKGFIPFHTIDGAKTVVLPGEDGKRVNIVWAHTGPLVEKVAKTGSVELGPRHVVSLKAWAGTKSTDNAGPKKAPAAKKAPVAKKAPAAKKTAPKPPAVEDGEHRGRGRPRRDGLLPGSYEVGVLNHAHETRTVVPQEILDKMSPEARLVEEARNTKITSGVGIKRGRPSKSEAAKITHISAAKKAKRPAPAAQPGKRKLIRRAAQK